MYGTSRGSAHVTNHGHVKYWLVTYTNSRATIGQTQPDWFVFVLIFDPTLTWIWPSKDRELPGNRQQTGQAEFWWLKRDGPSRKPLCRERPCNADPDSDYRHRQERIRRIAISAEEEEFLKAKKKKKTYRNQPEPHRFSNCVRLPTK